MIALVVCSVVAVDMGFLESWWVTSALDCDGVTSVWFVFSVVSSVEFDSCVFGACVCSSVVMAFGGGPGCSVVEFID